MKTSRSVPENTSAAKMIKTLAYPKGNIEMTAAAAGNVKND
jgi:hypothetical protein